MSPAYGIQSSPGTGTCFAPGILSARIDGTCSGSLGARQDERRRLHRVQDASDVDRLFELVEGERRPFGSGLVKDGTQVIRPHVEVRRSKDPVGEARATFVEQDDP